MSNLDQNTYRAGTATYAQEIDQGLRSFMLGIYNYMTVALVVTAISAYAFAEIGALRELITAPVFNKAGEIIGYKRNLIGMILMFAPLIAVFFFMGRIQRMSASATQTAFWAFSVLIGASMSIVLLNFSGASVAKVFFITASAFAALSLWGYTTKKDLSGWGSFLYMGVIGLIIASLVNLLLGSPGMHYVICIVGVGIFAGLTAYDTQDLKNIYLGGIERQGQEAVQKASIFGAFRLYLDFINMFLFLVQLLGSRE